MLWIKPQGGAEWYQNYQQLFYFSQSIECYFYGQLICDSSNTDAKLQVNVDNFGGNQWMHVSVTGNNLIGSQLTLQTNSGLIATDNQSQYLTIQQQGMVCIGTCNTLPGFIGAVREFKMINSYLNQAVISNNKNNYLFYDQQVLGYYRFSNQDLLRDEFANRFASLMKNGTIQNSSISDFSQDYQPIDICYPVSSVSNFANFSNIFNLTQTTLDQSWFPQNLNWGYTLSLWLYLNPSSCSQSRPDLAQANCHLFLLQNAFMVYLSSPNQLSAYIFSTKVYLQVLTPSLFIPQNTWINIQFGLNQYNGYDLRLYDAMGRMIAQTSSIYGMGEQQVKSKTISLMRGFQGMVRSLCVYSARKALPLVESSNINNCLAYYKFDPSGIINNFNSTQDKIIVNQCNSNNKTFMNATSSIKNTSFSVTFAGSQFQNLPYGQQLNTLNMFNTSQSLFDGIACDDGSMVNQFNSINSYIQANLSYQNQINAMTVEFWFKLNQNVSSNISYLFSMISQSLNTEYYSINMNLSSGMLQCLPQGPLQNQNVQFSTFNFTNVNSPLWLHLSCSIGTLFYGHLYMQNQIDDFEQGINFQGFQLPADNYTIQLGNSITLKQGTPGLRMKDVRIWLGQRQLQDVRSSMSTQLDPRTLNNPALQLLAYYRLDEGVFSYFNLASIVNQNLSAFAQSYNDLKFVSDPNLLICPLGTFISQDQTKCYQNPITVGIVAIYPVYNALQDQVYWKFDTTQSQLTNSQIASQILVSWKFSDPILSNIVGADSQNSTLIIPAQAFRENAKYQFTVNMSNSIMTLNQQYSQTFVPMSCQYFLVNGISADSFYYNYLNPQSSENISFTLNLVKLRSYCQEIAFYNDFQPQLISWQMVTNQDTQQIMTPNLNITWDPIVQYFTVIIPQNEQYKLPILTDIKFIFSFSWQNKEHNDIFPSANLTFQNAIMTINFNQPGSILIPILTVQTPYVLLGQNASIDGSQSFITNRIMSQKQNGLQFLWNCPSDLQQSCQNMMAPTLIISNFTGQYNYSYTIGLTLSWNNIINGTNNIQQTQLSGQVIWYNATQPKFNLVGPSSGIMLTAISNRFSVLIADTLTYNSLPNLTISWTMIPSIPTSLVNFTMHNLYMTVMNGAFKPLTSYTVTATITNALYPVIQVNQSFQFTTNLPPSGGQITVNPMAGYWQWTNFTVSLSNWNSSNLPMNYQVWSASDSGGTQLQQQLTGSWISLTQNFIFQAVNLNPIIVIIKDNIGEQILQRVPIMVKILPKVSNNQSDTNGLIRLQAQDSTNGVNFSDTMSTQLDLILINVTNLYNLSFDLGNQTYALVSGVSTIKIYTNSQSLNDSSIANQSIVILDQILSVLEDNQTISDSIFINPQDGNLTNNFFVMDFMLCLSNLLNYTSGLPYDLPNNQSNSTRRMLQSDNSTTTINDTSNQTSVNSENQTINTTNYNTTDNSTVSSNTTSSDSNSTNTQDNSTSQVNSTTDSTSNSNTTENSTQPSNSDNSTNLDSNNSTSIDNSSLSDNSTSQNNNSNNSNNTNNDIGGSNDTNTNNTNGEDSSSTDTNQNQSSNISQAPYFDPVFQTSQLLNLKQRFSSLLCSYIVPDTGSQYLTVDSFDLYLEVFSNSIIQPLQNVSYIFKGDNITTVTYQTNQLLQDLSTQSALDSICVQTYLNKQPLFSLSAINNTQLSNVFIESYIDADPDQDFDQSEYIQNQYGILMNLTQAFTRLQAPDSSQNNQSTGDNTTIQSNSTSDSNTTLPNGNTTDTTSSNNSSSETNNNSTVTPNSTYTQSNITCMAFNSDTSLWDQSYCETTVNQESNIVQCSCTDDFQLQGVFILSDLFVAPEPIQQDIAPSSNSFLAITLWLIILSLSLPSIVSYFDWKDLNEAEQLEKTFNIEQRNLHMKLLTRTPSMRYWFLTHRLTPSGTSYHDENTPSFTGAPTMRLSPLTVSILCHPLLNSLFRFDGFDRQRKYRIMPWLAQLFAFSIIIILCGPSWFSKQEYDLESSLSMIRAGIIGAFALLPIPYLGALMRSKVLYPREKSKKVAKIGSKRVSFHEQPTPQGGMGDGRITPFKATNDPQNQESMKGPCETEEAMHSQDKVEELTSFNAIQNRRVKCLNKTLMLLTICLGIASTVLSFTILNNQSANQQSCVVGTFFIACLGSLFVTHILYCIWQYLLYLCLDLDKFAFNISKEGYQPSFLQELFADSSLLTHLLEQNFIVRAFRQELKMNQSLRRNQATPMNEHHISAHIETAGNTTLKKSNRKGADIGNKSNTLDDQQHTGGDDQFGQNYTTEHQNDIITIQHDDEDIDKRKLQRRGSQNSNQNRLQVSVDDQEPEGEQHEYEQTNTQHNLHNSLRKEDGVLYSPIRQSHTAEPRFRTTHKNGVDILDKRGNWFEGSSKEIPDIIDTQEENRQITEEEDNQAH